MAGKRFSDIDAHVAQRIGAARRIAGLSQEETAAKIGVTFQQLQKYEKGANRISAGKLALLADALHVPIAWLFEDAPGLRGTNGHAAAAHLLTAFLGTPGAADLARSYLAIPDPTNRQVVTAVALALGHHAGAAS